MQRIDLTDLEELRKFRDRRHVEPFACFPPGKVRERLRKAKFIERYNPTVKSTGRIKPWRLTRAGHEAIDNAD